MEFRDIEGFSDYLISENGQVYSLKSDMFLSPWINHNGFFKVNLCNDGISSSVYVHRLVAKAFLENLDNKFYVRHIDKNKQNNHVSNLMWSEHKKQSRKDRRKILNMLIEKFNS